MKDDKHDNSDSRGKLGILVCNSGKPFAQKVVSELEEIIAKEHGSNDMRILESKETWFANTESKIEIKESIRNRDVYVFQDVENKTAGLSVNDNYMALRNAVDSVRRADAHYITLVIPVFPYARQDKPRAREGLTAPLVARDLENDGATRIITLDVHNDAIHSFFRKTILENLHASKNFMDYVKEKMGYKIRDLVVVAPDAGGADRARYYASRLGTKLALLYKERDYSKPNVVEKMSLLGDVKDKTALVVDDMIDTAGTLAKAAKKLSQEGVKKIYFAASLCLFNQPATERITRACNDKNIADLGIIGTDAVFHGSDFKKKNLWYEEVSVAKYFARVIYNVNKGRSISRLLE